tara:strand:+ start:634 stop:1605 length:972 start_codon:yes stop_codon:yes gene_type:complete
MKEIEIRPKKIFDKFVSLATQDVKKFFNKKKKLIKCVACNKNGKFSFKKNGFSYCLCQNCKTLFVNPRPNEIDFSNYYQKSSSIKFLANNLYKKTQKLRRKKIWKPKAKIIAEKLKKNKFKNFNYVDIGGGYGIFAEEISKYTKKKVTVIEPSPYMAEECRKKKLNVVEKFLEKVEKNDLPNNKKCFTSFELFEHLHNPSKFIRKLSKLMNKNDIFIFTTLSSTGLDISTLWKNSIAVSPPYHINFLNPQSVYIFLQRHGFKIIDITTPGKIDIEILENNKNLITDKFWKNFLDTATQSEKSKMQDLISNLNLSSHMMVICKK